MERLSNGGADDAKDAISRLSGSFPRWGSAVRWLARWAHGREVTGAIPWWSGDKGGVVL